MVHLHIFDTYVRVCLKIWYQWFQCLNSVWNDHGHLKLINSHRFTSKSIGEWSPVRRRRALEWAMRRRPKSSGKSWLLRLKFWTGWDRSSCAMETHTHIYIILIYLSMYLSFLFFSFLSYLFLSFLFFSYLFLSFLILSFLFLSFLIFSYLIFSFLIFSYLFFSYLFFSYLIHLIYLSI